jgi:argininosuccinate lyase
MKLWQKGFETNKEIEKFTVGKDRQMDLMLAEFDVLGSLAHIKMLQSINLITEEELEILTKELLLILKDIKSGNFTIEDDVEDVHSQVELLLTRKLGDIGKKIHSGRSRNDQVLVDLKLFIRSKIKEVVQKTKTLFDTLIELSEKYKEVDMPGYTHYQVAMPSTFGLWLGSYAESLVDDLTVMNSAWKVTNKNPLGSAAGYGSNFPLNRSMTTNLLGFDTLNYNSIYAQMGRGKTERIVAFALSQIGMTLSKLSQDICLFSNQNYGFLKLPDELTTGSSIMPHKKNPDVFELVRAKMNKLNSLPNEITSIISNLSSGYHRDMQIIKESFMPSFDDILDCLEIVNYSLKEIEVKKDILSDPRYQHIHSVEEVNNLVLSGLSFRDAYRKVGEDIQNGTYQRNTEDVKYTHQGSIGNLCNDDIIREMDFVISDYGFFKVDNSINNLCR